MIIRKIKYQLTTAPAIFVSICYALVLRVWAKDFTYEQITNY